MSDYEEKYCVCHESSCVKYVICNIMNRYMLVVWPLPFYTFMLFVYGLFSDTSSCSEYTLLIGKLLPCNFRATALF